MDTDATMNGQHAEPLIAGLLSDQLRDIMRGSDLSQNELARRSGVHKTQLSRFMNGHRQLSLDNVDRISRVLQLTVATKQDD